MAEVEAAIGELGGCVAPKLNWSSPHDAVWVSADKSLACRNADEVQTCPPPCICHKWLHCTPDSVRVGNILLQSQSSLRDARWMATTCPWSASQPNSAGLLHTAVTAQWCMLSCDERRSGH